MGLHSRTMTCPASDRRHRRPSRSAPPCRGTSPAGAADCQLGRDRRERAARSRLQTRDRRLTHCSGGTARFNSRWRSMRSTRAASEGDGLGEQPDEHLLHERPNAWLNGRCNQSGDHSLSDISQRSSSLIEDHWARRSTEPLKFRFRYWRRVVHLARHELRKA